MVISGLATMMLGSPLGSRNTMQREPSKKIVVVYFLSWKSVQMHPVLFCTLLCMYTAFSVNHSCRQARVRETNLLKLGIVPRLHCLPVQESGEQMCCGKA